MKGEDRGRQIMIHVLLKMFFSTEQVMNCQMVGWLWNTNRKDTVATVYFKVLHKNLLRRTKQNKKLPGYLVSRLTFKHTGYPEYKTGQLTTQPRHSFQRETELLRNLMPKFQGTDNFYSCILQLYINMQLPLPPTCQKELHDSMPSATSNCR
jgi:hypothetical protein